MLRAKSCEDVAALRHLNPFNPSNVSASNIIQSHIPSPSHLNHQNIASRRAIGGAGVGGSDSDSNSLPHPPPNPVQSSVENPSQAIRVSEDNMTNYLFEFLTVKGTIELSIPQ